MSNLHKFFLKDDFAFIILILILTFLVVRPIPETNSQLKDKNRDSVILSIESNLAYLIYRAVGW